MKAAKRLAAGVAMAAVALAAQAATVTYTFTEYDTDDSGQQFIVYQLRHTLDHFLAPSEEVNFALSDLWIDPNGLGGTVALQQYASSDLPTFGAGGQYVTFGGAAFCKLVSCDDSSAGRYVGQSYDMNVQTEITNNPTGSWTDSSQTGLLERLDITVFDGDTPPNRTPEPAPLALLMLGLAAAYRVRRRSA